MKLNKTLTALAIGASFGLSGQAFALGTVSGTDISNTVTLNYNVSSVAQAPIGSVATFRVDNIVDMELADNTGTFTIIPGGSITYTYALKNSGNKTQFFKLDLINQIADTTDTGDITIPAVTFSKTGGTVTSSITNGVVTIEPDADISFTAQFTFPMTANVGVTSRSIKNGDTFNILATATATTDVNGTTKLLADVDVNKNDTTGGTPNLTAKELVVFAEAASTDSVLYNGVITVGSTTTVETAEFTDSTGSTGPTLTVKVLNDAICDATVAYTDYSVGNGSGNECPGLASYRPKAIPGALVEYTLTAKNSSTSTGAQHAVFTHTLPITQETLDNVSLSIAGTAVSDLTATYTYNATTYTINESGAADLTVNVEAVAATETVVITFTALVK